MPSGDIDKIIPFGNYSKQGIKFAEFQRTVEKYGLATFVTFVMYKNFEHTDLDLLSDDEKAILIEECEPLLKEAESQDSSIQ